MAAETQSESEAKVNLKNEPATVILMNGNGEFVAQWKIGEFPDWIANYISGLPNENANWRYYLQVGSKRHAIYPGNLAIEIYNVLLANDLV